MALIAAHVSVATLQMELTANHAQSSVRLVQVLQTARHAMVIVLLSTLLVFAQLLSTQLLDLLRAALVRSAAQLASLQASVPLATQRSTVILPAHTVFA